MTLSRISILLLKLETCKRALHYWGCPGKYLIFNVFGLKTKQGKHCSDPLPVMGYLITPLRIPMRSNIRGRSQLCLILEAIWPDFKCHVYIRKNNIFSYTRKQVLDQIYNIRCNS